MSPDGPKLNLNKEIVCVVELHEVELAVLSYLSDTWMYNTDYGHFSPHLK